MIQTLYFAKNLLAKPSNAGLSNFLSRNFYVRRQQSVAYDPTLNPKQYYDELLNATVVDEDGCYSIGPTHLSNMIDLYISFPETPQTFHKTDFLKNPY
jgi:hypothetical protein